MLTINKVTTKQEIINCFSDGQTLMIGGILGIGTPLSLVELLVEKGFKDLTLISNDTAFPDQGTGKLIINKQVKKLTASYIGSNPETVRQMYAGELEVELVPQGTLAERIRCAGAGLGGVLTLAGLGTALEQGKQKISTNGKVYLLETPLSADIALIKAAKADTFGNLLYRNTARNFNPLIAMAAKLVIAEVEEIVEAGQIDPNEVMTPGIFVDKIIKV